MRDYTTATGVLGSLELVAWVVVVLSLLAGGLTWQSTGYATAAMVGALGAISGLLIVCMVQLARAQIDTAINTREMLAEMRRAARPQSADPNAPFVRIEPSMGKLVKVYKGRAIMRESSGVSVDGRPFDNVLVAERNIDGR